MLDTMLWAGINLATEGQNSAFSAKAITRDLTRHSLHLTVRPLPFTKHTRLGPVKDFLNWTWNPKMV